MSVFLHCLVGALPETIRQKAPEIVVYDFACAPAHYCILREPKFFRDTRFLLDEFHAYGHTACSASGFDTAAMKEQPEFQEIFTSAAECGHAMLRRIRKSFSYMSEGNANLFLWVAIQALNRRKLESLGSKTVQGEKCVDVKAAIDHRADIRSGGRHKCLLSGCNLPQLSKADFKGAYDY
ncbi:uncharacterized protein IAS62_003053 [Cryptococcus decagattii]|uniref:Uncharacterized protein n=1 Tax=Cryptococcus decagattii TaxID=1859122 RepID=A0ABZ2AWK7_9TREE